MAKGRILVVCTTDSMVWNFLVPHIQKIKNDGYDVECACSVTGDFFELLESKYKLVMHQVDFVRTPYSLKNIKAFFQLWNIVKSRNISTIFCHEPVGGALGRIVGHITNCRVVYMAHGFHFFDGAPNVFKIYYYIEKLLSRYTDALITINKEDYEASLRFKAKENYYIPGIGIDISKFAYSPNREYIREELGLDTNSFILLSVGELIPRKNHEVIIDVVAKLKDPNIHYIIVGNGELEQYFNEKIKVNNLKNIHFLGYRRDICNLCNSADVFVMPSLQEGLSVALMEAMACGMPIIASRIRGNIDLIDEGKGGYLLDVKDIDGYMDRVMLLRNNEHVMSEMGKYNIRRVGTYSIENVSNMLIPIVESAVRDCS